MNIEYIAHKGKKYTIEWYYNNRGASDALEYFNDLPIARKKKLLSLFITMGEMGKIFKKDKFINEDDQIYAFKPSPDRFLCFFFKGSKNHLYQRVRKKDR
jgi:hypothetical protein